MHLFSSHNTNPVKYLQTFYFFIPIFCRKFTLLRSKWMCYFFHRYFLAFSNICMCIIWFVFAIGWMIKLRVMDSIDVLLWIFNIELRCENLFWFHMLTFFSVHLTFEGSIIRSFVPSNHEVCIIIFHQSFFQRITSVR